jgi:hypothetical protein
MNQKNSSFLYGILAVIVLLVFLLILYFLGRENSQPATINDKVTGFYSSAPINNRCSITPITEPTTLLPGFNSPQNCSENYTCVQNGTPDNPFGYCKVPITENTELTKIYSCNTVYDCAPSTDPTEIVYCNGTCQTTTLSVWNSKSPNTYGGLYSFCDFNTACDNNLICSNVLNNFSIAYGECLIADGSGTCSTGNELGCCTSDEQCLGGKCDFNKGSGDYGLCISRIAPAEICDVNYCDTGFGCDFSQTNPSNNLCQPLLGNGPAQYGKLNSFCLVGTTPGSGVSMSCDSGLVCNFELLLGSTENYPSSLYPSLLNMGQCALPNNALKDSCSGSGACIEPLVCNNGTCANPIYLENSTTPITDVNYCGPEYTQSITNYPANGSSGACLNGYTCVKNTGMSILSDSDFCVGVSETSTAIGLCNSSTSSSQKYGNFCNNNTGGGAGCTNRYIGVFLQGYSYLGVWRFIELPPQNIASNVVNGNSKISVYQETVTTTTGSNVTYPITKIIFFPNVNVGDNFFYYTEFSTYNLDPNVETNTLKYSPTWYTINVSMNAAHNHLNPNQKFYINNSGTEATFSTGVTYGSLAFTYDTLSYQLVGGGGGGGGGTDGNGDISDYGGGGGGSGNIIGYVGGLNTTFNYYLPTDLVPSIATTSLLTLTGTDLISVTLGVGGSGGVTAIKTKAPDGGNGSNTILYLDGVLTDQAIGGIGGIGADGDNSGEGGDGYNGGGGGSGGSSFKSGGSGDTATGGEDGQTAGSGTPGTGGGINYTVTPPVNYATGGVTDTGSNDGDSYGGGGGGGTAVYDSSNPRTGGTGAQGNRFDPNVNSSQGIDYTGAGGGGGAAFNTDLLNGSVGGKGYAILDFYFANQGQLINLLDIKFTPSGNFALFVEETMPINFPLTPGSSNVGGTPETYKRIYWESFHTLQLPSSSSNPGTLIYTASKNGPMFCNPSTLPSSSDPGDLDSIADDTALGNMYFNVSSSYYNSNTFVWDIDDLYNNSIVIGFKENPSTGSDFIFFSSTVTKTGGNFELNDVTALDTFSTPITITNGYPNYVKYFTDFTVVPSDANFLYNYNASGQNRLVSNNNPSTDYFDIELGSPLSFGLSFSKYGTINNFIYYYMSGDGEIRSVSAKKGETQPIESNVYGYAPVEIVTADPLSTTDALMLGFTSAGNIDSSLYALVETCSP